ncbi:MAG TPA: hypothetical protein VJZ71_05685 [Phycisphaerae bacterium]|nr:hypothetical protein [Phycisphaerae bacterium]
MSFRKLRNVLAFGVAALALGFAGISPVRADHDSCGGGSYYSPSYSYYGGDGYGGSGYSSGGYSHHSPRVYLPSYRSSRPYYSPSYHAPRHHGSSHGFSFQHSTGHHGGHRRGHGW